MNGREPGAVEGSGHDDRVAEPTESTGLTTHPFREEILREAPRILGLMDREPASPTLGCCDRTYWAWKFVDFSGSRFQEALCVLAFLWADRHEDNPYSRNDPLYEWIGHGLDFWCSLQHRDGSFDEAYPLERSLAATAFTTFYVSEALESLAVAGRPVEAPRVIDTIDRAGGWLTENDESHGVLSNHLAAAAVASEHAYRVTGSPKYRRRGEYFIDRILAKQSGEGWFEEYGGADPGYQTHGSFYLARYLELNPLPRLEDALQRANEFLAHFVHADGSLGGEYASRNTKTYYPAAFEMMAARDPHAAWIAARMRPSLLSNATVSLRGIDVYNYFPFLNNYVFACRACESRGTTPVEKDPLDGTPASAEFPEAGLLLRRRERLELVVSVSKGGVVKAFDRGTRRLLLSDCGYVGRLPDGRTVSSQYLAHDRVVSWSDSEIRVEGAFMDVTRPVMSPFRFVAFRLFTLVLGRAPAASRWLKRLLVRVLIDKRKPLAIAFVRTIRTDGTQIVIDDELEGADLSRLDTLERTSTLATVHMGSSRYYVANELGGARQEQRKVDLSRGETRLQVQTVVRVERDA